MSNEERCGNVYLCGGGNSRSAGTEVLFSPGVQSVMKIHVLSDLHLEFQGWIPPKTDADIIVLAGDVHVGVRGIEWARRSFPLCPVVYVPGNHEFYGEDIQDLTEELFRQGRRLGVDVTISRWSATTGSKRFGPWTRERSIWSGSVGCESGSPVNSRGLRLW